MHTEDFKQAVEERKKNIAKRPSKSYILKTTS